MIVYLIAAAWIALAATFTAGWTTRARLTPHLTHRPRVRRRVTTSASLRRPRRAHPRTIQTRRRTLSLRPSLRLSRPSPSRPAQELH